MDKGIVIVGNETWFDKNKKVLDRISAERKLLNRAVGNHMVNEISYRSNLIIKLISELSKV